MEEGSSVSYTDGAGVVGTGRFEFGVVVRGEESDVEPAKPRVTLGVAPPRSTDRLRFLVEKVVELGVDEIAWIKTQYGQGRVPSASKLEAWTLAAVEQSRRAYVPTIGRVMRPIADVVAGRKAVIADQGGDELVTHISGEDLVVVVGPEGGWGPSDAVDGFPNVRLSAAVLRTETAAIAALTLLRSDQS
jgi:16S rRNA (uracil1498-N3)-methyltransferase